MDTRFQQLVSQSQVVLTVSRTLVQNEFSLCDLSTATEPLQDLMSRADFVGIIGLVGLKPQAAFIEELTNTEYSAIHASFLQLYERALNRVESLFSNGSLEKN